MSNAFNDWNPLSIRLVSFSCLALPLMALIIGCGGQDASKTAAKCAESDLVAQCPPGTTPELSASATSQCSASGEADLIEQSGAVTGSCQGAGECKVLCNFSTPCFCGVDRITAEGVFCVQPCAKESACGNGQCEPGENPIICPIDCGARCEQDASRCNGNDREVCSVTGVYERIACPPETTCTDSGDKAQCIARCERAKSRCNGNEREVCNEFGRYEAIPCPSGSQCREISNDESQCIDNNMNMDAGVPEVDASMPNMDPPDARVSDMNLLDATLVDMMVIDAQLPDMAIPDMRIVDAMVPAMETTLSPSVDTFLQSTQEIGMDGRDVIVIGNGQGLDKFLGLIRFDLDNLLNVTIENARLCLTPGENQMIGRQLSVHISRIANDWGIAITWAMRDALGAPVDVSDVAVFIADQTCLDVTAIVTSWANMEPNYGFRIEGQPGSQETWVFKSSEAMGGGAPQLHVTYR